MGFPRKYTRKETIQLLEKGFMTMAPAPPGGAEGQHWG